MRIDKKLILFFAVLILTSSFVSAATYYVCDNAASCNYNSSGWQTGNDGNSCTSKSAPCKTIKGGISKIDGGDILIIGDGLYKGMSNMICSDTGWEWNGIPDGSASSYTIIKAEHDFQVIIDGEGLDNHMPIYITDTSYVQFEGLTFRHSGKNNGATNVHLYYCDHIKMLRCAAYEPASSANPPTDDVAFNFYVQRSTYCLLEDCFAWGRARYHFIFGGEWGNHAICSNNIMRRCVARYDKSEEDSNEQAGAFVNYGAGPNYFQNCIAIDGADPGNCGTGTMRAFYGANGCTGVVVDSSIALANVDGRLQWESSSTGTHLKNSVFWDMRMGSNWYSPPSLSDIRVENCVFGDLGPGSDPYGVGLNIEDKAQYVKNNIFTSISDVALIKSDSGVDYNVFYGNGADYSQTNAGSHDITNKNPRTNGLGYLPRIESGSYLSSTCENNGRCGAEILKKIGVSGTLYRESGWNTLTNENLWPFPNEDIIKELMSQYNLHSVNGARGFAASGNGLYGGPITLTSYIWEYLGNACPADICNYNIQYHPADSNQNNIIEMTELIAFIARWKTNQANINEVLEALNRWFKGE